MYIDELKACIPLAKHISEWYCICSGDMYYESVYGKVMSHATWQCLLVCKEIQSICLYSENELVM